MKFLKLLFSVVLVLAATAAAAAQDDYPSRPIKIITTTSAGGLSDIFMRALGEELRRRVAATVLDDDDLGGHDVRPKFLLNLSYSLTRRDEGRRRPVTLRPVVGNRNAVDEVIDILRNIRRVVADAFNVLGAEKEVRA